MVKDRGGGCRQQSQGDDIRQGRRVWKRGGMYLNLVKERRKADETMDSWKEMISWETWKRRRKAYKQPFRGSQALWRTEGQATISLVLRGQEGGRREDRQDGRQREEVSSHSQVLCRPQERRPGQGQAGQHTSGREVQAAMGLMPPAPPILTGGTRRRTSLALAGCLWRRGTASRPMQAVGWEGGGRLLGDQEEGQWRRWLPQCSWVCHRDSWTW